MASKGIKYLAPLPKPAEVKQDPLADQQAILDELLAMFEAPDDGPDLEDAYYQALAKEQGDEDFTTRDFDSVLQDAEDALAENYVNDGRIYDDESDF
jgi:hypothetical protein